MLASTLFSIATWFYLLELQLNRGAVMYAPFFQDGVEIYSTNSTHPDPDICNGLWDCAHRACGYSTPVIMQSFGYAPCSVPTWDNLYPSLGGWITTWCTVCLLVLMLPWAIICTGKARWPWIGYWLLMSSKVIMLCLLLFWSIVATEYSTNKLCVVWIVLVALEALHAGCTLRPKADVEAY